MTSRCRLTSKYDYADDDADDDDVDDDVDLAEGDDDVEDVEAGGAKLFFSRDSFSSSLINYTNSIIIIIIHQPSYDGSSSA